MITLALKDVASYEACFAILTSRHALSATVRLGSLTSGRMAFS